LAAALAKYPDVPLVRIEDAQGKPLGRSFHVKLWPTFVFLKDGEVVKRVARPAALEIHEGVEAIARKTA
jgi:thioredoxin 1